MSQKIQVQPTWSIIAGEKQLPRPIVASPKKGNPNKINLTIMITYAGKPGTSVDMSMVEIEIPMGESARALSDNREGIGIDFNFGPELGSWVKKSVPGNKFKFRLQEDPPVALTNEHSLIFTFKDVTINKEPGVVPIKVKLKTVQDDHGTTTAEGNTTISKMPSGFYLSDLEVTPESTIIQNGDPVTVSWQGSGNAEYSLKLERPGLEKEIAVEAAGSFTIPNPEKGIPALTKTTTIILEARVMIDGETSTYEKSCKLDVEDPAPEIVCFEGQIRPEGDMVKLILDWETKYADACFISGDPHAVEEDYKGYTIKPTSESPLRSSYTLTAQNDLTKISSPPITLDEWGEDRNIPVRSHPRRILFDPNGTRIVVLGSPAAGPDWLVMLDITSYPVRELDHPKELPYFCRDIAFANSGSHAFLTDGGGKIVVLDLTTNPIQIHSRLEVDENPFRIAIAPDGRRAFVTHIVNGKISVLDLTSTPISVSQTIPLDGHLTDFAFAPKGNRAFITNHSNGTVLLLDTHANPVQIIGNPIQVGTNPNNIAVAPDGDSVFVTNLGSDSISVLDITKETASVRQTIPVGARPAGIGITPDGSRVFVANSKSNTVSILDTTTTPISICQTIEIAWEPRDLTISPDGSRVFITKYHGERISTLVPKSISGGKICKEI